MNRRPHSANRALPAALALLIAVPGVGAAQPYGQAPNPQLPYRQSAGYTASQDTWDSAPPQTLAPTQRRKRSYAKEKVTGCLVGGVLGGLLGAAMSDGGNRNASIATGAAVGCVAGFAFASNWSARDRAALDAQTEQMLDRPVGQSEVWVAPESRQPVSFTTATPVVETKPLEFEYLENVAPPQKGVQVIARPYRTTDVLRLRSSPDATSDDNIVSRFNRGEVVEVIGASPDQRWAMIGYDGVIVGYSSFEYLQALDERQTLRTVATSKPRPERAAPSRAAATTTPTAPSRATSSSRPVQVAQVAAPRVRTARVVASTRCKSVVAVSGQQTDRKKGCAQPSGDWKFA